MQTKGTTLIFHLRSLQPNGTNIEFSKFRYLDTRLITRRKWPSGNELKVSSEKHSIQSTNIPEETIKGSRIAYSSEQKINEGEKSNCFEVQDKTRKVRVENKHNSQNTNSSSSLCAVL